jgi:hypothetical protein
MPGLALKSAVVKNLRSLLIIASLLGCAPEIIVRPAQLQPNDPTSRQMRVTLTVEARSTAGFHSALPVGTVLEPRGQIAEGIVMAPRNAVLTAEGAHIAEAYAVISGSKWVGFWLPVQRAFSPLQAPVAIQMEPY